MINGKYEADNYIWYDLEKGLIFTNIDFGVRGQLNFEFNGIMLYTRVMCGLDNVFNGIELDTNGIDIDTKFSY